MKKAVSTFARMRDMFLKSSKPVRFVCGADVYGEVFRAFIGSEADAMLLFPRARWANHELRFCNVPVELLPDAEPDALNLVEQP